jgi:hypothetical protein
LEERSEANRIIRVLIEKQRDLSSSTDVVKRFRTLWIIAMLEERLAGCTDREIGELMDVVLERFGIFEPEMAISEHARRRLLRSAGVGVQSESTNRDVGGE